MMNARRRVIEKLNKEFGKAIGGQIPISQPIRSHRRKYKSQGGLSWYFLSNLPSTDQNNKNIYYSDDEWRVDSNACNVGSVYTMTQLLSNQNWVLVKNLSDRGALDIYFADDVSGELCKDNIVYPTGS